jgi:hypothetical protein
MKTDGARYKHVGDISGLHAGDPGGESDGGHAAGGGRRRRCWFVSLGRLVQPGSCSGSGLSGGAVFFKEKPVLKKFW